MMPGFRDKTAVSALLLVLTSGCSPSGPNGLGNGGTGSGTGETSGTASAMGGASGTSTLAGEQGGAGSTSTGFIDPSTTGTLMSCATSTDKAKLIPLAMYIMFDKSGSMQDNNKWTNASTALDAFFADKAAAGLQVALRFFPDGDCAADQCDVNACATPLVPAAALTDQSAPTDTQEKLLIDAVQSVTPSGNTPMYAALSGAVQWGTTYFGAHPDEKAIVVLVTDGDPNGCNNDVDAIADVAGNGHSVGVDTFAIGLQGSNQTTLDKIASKGGTTAAFLIGNGNAEADLVAALQAIRGKAISCDLPLPKPDNGQTIDPKKVNVEFTPTTGAPETIGNVANAAACGSAGGWYYDDPAAPTKITLCTATCSEVQADATGEVDIELGCDTVPE